MGRLRGIASAALVLGLALVGPASAGADHPGGAVSFEKRTVAGELITVMSHSDPVAQFKAGSDEIAGSTSPGATGRSAGSSLCPTVDRTSDDRANDPQPGARAIKVLYAHPADVGNRIARFGPVIQAGADGIADLIASESGGQLSMRFDRGTFEGAHCLDIQRVPLKHPAAHYVGLGVDPAFSAVGNEVASRLGPQGGPRNLLIYVDRLNLGNVAGVAEAFIQDGVSDQPSAAAVHDTGGFFAQLYGRGGTDFFLSDEAFAPGTTSRFQVDVALHEVSHTLGAVQFSAPNGSGAGHCNDQYDLMCYEDGGPGSLFVDPSCDGPPAPSDPYGPGSEAWDCNKDDFFNPVPPNGSYLEDHWNLADSAFLCLPAACAPPDAQPPNTTIYAEPLKASRSRRAKVRFQASERSSFSCRVDRRKPRKCSSPFKARLRPGKHTIRITATDRAGLSDPSPARTSFRVLRG